jgi:hypothetical protein
MSPARYPKGLGPLEENTGGSECHDERNDERNDERGAEAEAMAGGCCIHGRLSLIRLLLEDPSGYAGAFAESAAGIGKKGGRGGAGGLFLEEILECLPRIAGAV